MNQKQNEKSYRKKVNNTKEKKASFITAHSTPQQVFYEWL